MKAVYRSIKPYWLYLIIIGKKTIEVGKSFPKAEDWNKEVFLHCSKDMKSFKRIPEKYREWMRKYLGKVACRFVCDEIEKLRYDALEMAYMARKYRDIKLLNEEFFKGTQVTYQEAYDYCEGMTFDEEDTDYFYGWHISDLVIYDKPRELSEFLKATNVFPTLIHDIAEEGNGPRYNKFYYPLKRPPQSWCYVEVQG
jgi:hypothetical protein